MSKTRTNCITPYKLLNKPAEYQQKISYSLPLRQIIIQQAKVPKLFSSLRPPSPPIRPSSQKYSVLGLPPFLSEYLNNTDTNSSSKFLHSKISSNSKLKKKFFSELDTKNRKKEYQHRYESFCSEKHYCEEKSNSLTPTPNFSEPQDSRKAFCGSLYKPYIVKISPRAKIRLYSQSPLEIERVGRGGRRRKGNKNNFQNTVDGDIKREAEIKAIPVQIDQYTKTYADKLKKVLEITEEARLEAEKLQF